jgi:hypothetical protein
MTPNGRHEVLQLSETQRQQLQNLLGPYFAQLQATQKMLNDIAGAYLTGMGLSPDVNIDMATGVLTPMKVTETNG